MNQEFLRRFILEERYLQNPPRKTDDFIKCCEQRGIRTSPEELEFLEREGLLYPLFRIDLPKIISRNGDEFCEPNDYEAKPGEMFVKYFPLCFDSGRNTEFKGWLDEGILYAPSERPFRDWTGFKGNETEHSWEKVISFYSTFQILWLREILDYWPPRLFFKQINVNTICLLPKGDQVIAHMELDIPLQDNKQRASPHDFDYLKHREWLQERYRQYFSWDEKKKQLLVEKAKFDVLLTFLLSTQHIYYPYSQSGSSHMTISGDSKEWHDKRAAFDPAKELESLHIDIEQVVTWYKEFADSAHRYLGVKRDDWLQLWKSIAWNEKSRLEGNVRLGIDYLQWALTLKQFIEDDEKRDILDVDELHPWLDATAILKTDPTTIEDRHSRRSFRNKQLQDRVAGKSFYNDRRRRLFYLVNDFGLDYQPRIIVFVEGETEQYCLGMLIERWYGLSANSIGIEFMDLAGVDKLLSTAETAEEIRKLSVSIERQSHSMFLPRATKIRLNHLVRSLRQTDVVINNLQSFISYNLEKWQIVPFFVADDEGRIKQILDSGKIIRFQGNTYDVPDSWKCIWGECDSPFQGKSFEFANFSDEEIASGMSAVLNRGITAERVQEVRRSGSGIKKIDESIDGGGNKIRLGEKLLCNLVDLYGRTKDEVIKTRPVFEAIRKIVDWAEYNHLPVNTEIERKNKDFIISELTKREKPDSTVMK